MEPLHETKADAMRTDTFRNYLVRANEGRFRDLDPARQRAAQRAGVVVMSFSEMLFLNLDLSRDKRSPNRPGSFRWLPDIHGWVFR